MQELKIADFLQTLRKAHGYTQQDVADYLHISNKTISKWETGQSLPDILSLKALAELYDVTVDEILNGKKDYKETPKKEKAIHELLNANISKKLNLFLLISSITFILGIFIDIILACLGYNLIGLFVNIFIIAISLIIYYVPYILNDKENLEFVANTKTKNNYTLISILSCSILLTYLTLFSYSYLIIFTILVSLGFLASIYLVLPRFNNCDKLFKVKLYLLLLCATINIFNMFYYLFDGAVDSHIIFYFAIIYLILLIIGFIIAITKKAKTIIPSIVSLFIAVLFIFLFIFYLMFVSESYASISLLYYLINPILLMIVAIALITIDSMLIKKEKNIILYLRKFILNINILASIFIIIMAIFYFIIPYGIYSNVFYYYNINLISSIFIFIAILIVIITLLFIPYIKYIINAILAIIFAIYTSNLYYLLPNQEASFIYNFANFQGVITIILAIIIVILLVISQVIKIKRQKV